jgi:hypothetical protein
MKRFFLLAALLFSLSVHASTITTSKAEAEAIFTAAGGAITVLYQVLLGAVVNFAFNTGNGWVYCVVTGVYMETDFKSDIAGMKFKVTTVTP